MPFVPELFSAPALARIEDKRQRDELVRVPFFDGLMAGEPDALVESFAAEPELHDPVRGRVKGTRAFEAFVAEMNSWLGQRNVSVEDVGHVVTERHGFEEVILHFDGERGESIFRSRSSPTVSPTDGSKSCGSTPAAGR